MKFKQFYKSQHQSRLNESSSDIFARGYCAEFALALHQITGLQIVSFDESIMDDDELYESSVHYACRKGQWFYDCRGKRRKAEIAYHLHDSNLQPLDKYTIRKLSSDDLENEGFINDDALQQAYPLASEIARKYKLIE